MTMALDEIKKVIIDNYESADCGLFFSRNVVGDTMVTLYNKGDVTIDICYDYSYFEIFGLTLEEEDEIMSIYKDLQEDDE